jgi:hypothetical protein
MSHSDGGKGSGRRKEDASKVRDNWDLIFGKGKTMIDDENNIEDFDEDDEEQVCSWCGGCGEGMYDGAACRKCHGTGVEPSERDCDDSDY